MNNQFKLYKKYCEKHSKNLQEFQMLLANSRINRYYNKEVEKKEKEVNKTLHNFLMLEVLELHSPILIKDETRIKEYHPLFTQLN